MKNEIMAGTWCPQAVMKTKAESRSKKWAGHQPGGPLAQGEKDLYEAWTQWRRGQMAKDTAAMRAAVMVLEFAQNGAQEAEAEWIMVAPRRVAAYAGNSVKTPFVNVEEKIDRFVGRRTQGTDSLQTGMQLQATAAQLHKSFGHRWWPKGVYRFKTHEEADVWMNKMLAQSCLPKT